MKSLFRQNRSIGMCGEEIRMFDLADAGELGFDADRLARIAPFLSDGTSD